MSNFYGRRHGHHAFDSRDRNFFNSEQEARDWQEREWRSRQFGHSSAYVLPDRERSPRRDYRDMESPFYSGPRDQHVGYQSYYQYSQNFVNQHVRRYAEERRDSEKPRREVGQDEELGYERVRRLRALKGGDPPEGRSREKGKVQLLL